MINLGDEVKCQITGFKGVAVGSAQYLYGCTKICIQSKMDKDGKFTEPLWFDEGQVIVTKRADGKLYREDFELKKVGGPNQSVPTRNLISKRGI